MGHLCKRRRRWLQPPDIVAINWSAIVSVDNLSDASAGIAAKDHAVVSAPVYRTDGTLVATSSDFYTSTHLVPIKWNENGDEQNTTGGSGSGRLVWTGSTGTGNIDGRPLGNSPLSDSGGSRTGNAESTNDDWINTSDATRRGPTTSLRVYALSEVISVAVDPSDNVAPTPDPMTFDTPPTALGKTSVTMTATTATDDSGVEYYFENTAGGGNDSGWQDEATYTDMGLSPGTEYTYRVQARDKSPNQNATGFSNPASATTDPADTTAPAILSLNPDEVSDVAPTTSLGPSR